MYIPFSLGDIVTLVDGRRGKIVNLDRYLSNGKITIKHNGENVEVGVWVNVIVNVEKADYQECSDSDCHCHEDE